jgi:hypothetical protein
MMHFSISLWAKSTGWGYSWQPLAFTDTVEGNTAKMYFDGTLADQATSTLTAGTVNPNADHLFVGGDLYYENEKFDGTIDSLWYFDQTIDSDAVGELFDPFA